VTADRQSSVSRKVRADAGRNRDRLLAAAKAAFADKGQDATMDEIGRAAGVGAGTLYRHFPNRDARVEAVYLNETRQLADAAARLADRHPPVESLRAWLRLFVDYIATKRVMAGALGSLAGGASALYAASTDLITQSLGLLIDRAVASGDIDLDLDPLDLLRALSSVANAGPGPASEHSAKRLVDILIAGLRRHPRPPVGDRPE
jgi:AcrR family transcriptional regulator